MARRRPSASFAIEPADLALARIGLGSNLGAAGENVENALVRLAELGAVTARSRLYRSRPWGVTDQPPFVNAAALLETALGPHALLAALKELERELGREAGLRWGPRAIDLDILAYDGLALDEAGLTIPHARLRERAFALVPLADVDPAFAALRDALPAEELASVEPL